MAKADPLGRFLANGDAALDALAALRSERSLRSFIDYTWDILEPGRTFVPGWAVDAICDHLTAVSDGSIRRLLINVPPGCMKSMTTSVFWPAWEWGPCNRPDLRYITASYSERLSTRDNRKCRQLIQSPRYMNAWGDRVQLSGDQNAKLKYETDATGFRLATSVGGVGVGERGDRFVIDDPHNITEGESEAKRDGALQWFTEVVPTRINDPDKSAIIVIMQRVHSKDVSGMILAKELGYEWLCLPMEYEERQRSFTSVPKKGVTAETVCRIVKEGEPIPRYVTPEELPLAGMPPDYEPKWEQLYCQDPRTEEKELLWPERFSERHIEDDLKKPLRAWGGEYAVAGQLQQRPAPREGGMFQLKDFLYLDARPEGGRWVRGWDFASSTTRTSAYTVGALLGIVDQKVVVADVVRKRTTPGQLEELVKATAARDGTSVVQSFPQDPGQSGKHQVLSLVRMLHGYQCHSSPETGAKADRAKPIAAQAEAGNLYLVRGAWNDAYVNELCLFPNGEFLDQADASSRAYTRLLAVGSEAVSSAPIFVGDLH